VCVDPCVQSWDQGGNVQDQVTSPKTETVKVLSQYLPSLVAGIID